MNSFYWLDQVQPSHHSIVGDQALNLGLLRQRGHQVLLGGVITTIAFERFLESIPWLESLFADLPPSTPHLDVDDARQLQAIARQIRHTIHSVPLAIDWLPSTWAAPALLLRPQLVLPVSAEVIAAEANSWLQPQICHPETIAVTLKRVWSEVFRAKSLLYWQRSNLPLQQIRLAVLVQPIATSAIASGRVQIRADAIELQAQRGLGGIATLADAIVDTYCLDIQGDIELQIVSKTHQLQLSQDSERTDLEWVAIAPAQQQASVLDHVQLQELVQLVRQIAVETHTGVDLEWLLMPAPQPQFQLTQILTSPLPAAVPIATLPSDRSVLVRGLAAGAGQVVGKAWVLDEPTIPVDLPAGVILVAAQLSLKSLSQLQPAGGMVLEQGSLISHSAIVARELGIPAIVGAANATQYIRTGDWVCLDGDRGVLYRVSPAEFSAAVEPVASVPLALIVPPDLQTALMVNLNRVALLEAIAPLPIAGIGLLRAELLLPADATELAIEQIASRIRPFVRAMYPRPVYYRSLDRPIHPPHLAIEANPLLGLHGTFRYQLDPRGFERELRALRQLQQEGYDNVHLLLPFVRTVEEFRFCRSLVQQIGLMRSPNFQLWIMAEVPSVLFLLPDYVAAGAQGMAIGSNDLTQLLLGIDRDQPQFAALSSQMQPAVLSAIRQLVQTARQLKIPCSICGQAPSQFPELVASLVEWGITAISVEPQAIEATAQVIARAEQVHAALMGESNSAH